MPQVGFLELLRPNRNVRRLWAGAVVSLFGDWINTLALYRVVQDLSSEGSVLGDGYVALALVFVVKLLPHARAAPLSSGGSEARLAQPSRARQRKNTETN